MEEIMLCKEAGFDEHEAEDDIENKYELEVKDTVVQSVDGVFLEGDDEEIKLLFFYLKPMVNPMENELVKCRCVAELRTSRSNFLVIARDIKKRVDSFRSKSDNIMFA
jgi:hypothetical protein